MRKKEKTRLSEPEEIESCWERQRVVLTCSTTVHERMAHLTGTRDDKHRVFASARARIHERIFLLLEAGGTGLQFTGSNTQIGSHSERVALLNSRVPADPFRAWLCSGSIWRKKRELPFR